MPKEIPAIIENSEKERTKEKSKTTLTNNEHASGELNASYAQEVYAAQSTGRKSERDKKMNDLSER